MSFRKNLSTLIALVQQGEKEQMEWCGICSIVRHPQDMCLALQEGTQEHAHATSTFLQQWPRYVMST